MSCVLRISGPALDVDALLTGCALVADAVWHRGSLRPGRGESGNAGANFVASEADFADFDAQVRETTEFVRANFGEVSRLVEFAGVEHAMLDFGVSIREDRAIKSCRLPSDLVALAARAGVALEVTYYKVGGESEGEASTRLRA